MNNEQQGSNAKAKVLVVDDQENNLIAMQRVLESLEIEIYLARSGRQALQLTNEHEFALILLDVQMPEMNGFQVAALMRQNKITENTPIVFITAMCQEKITAVEGYQDGEIDYLFKPVDTDLLISKVQIFLDLYRQKTQVMDKVLREIRTVNSVLTDNNNELLDSHSMQEQHPRILIVDDNPNNVFAIKSLLESMSLELYEAHSGNEALNLLLQHEFALVLMDVQMPGIDGFETAELMRSNRRTKQVPIIFVTAISKDEHYIKKGLQMGAVDYLFKPLDSVILQSKVAVFINYYTQKKTMERLVSQLNSSQEILAGKNQSLSQLAHTDVLTGLENRLNFEELLDKMIKFSKRYNKVFALMFLDLDNFKQVNDTFGHEGGDLLLKEVADRLISVVRAGDIIYQGGAKFSISRLGGDEFAILLEDINNRDFIGDIAKRIIASLAKPFSINHKNVHIGVSIGIAYFPEAGDTPEALSKNADIAMYRAKNAGKNCYQYFSVVSE